MQEKQTYDELRRALLKCRGGQKLAADLQGIWGCYQDARRNTEAMAFRGHRLLDQVRMKGFAVQHISGMCMLAGRVAANVAKQTSPPQ
jgi:hypothetical protein